MKVLTEAEFQLHMNKYDNELAEYMKAWKSECHKFKHNQVDYNPEMALWWKRVWLIKRVRRYLMGKVQHPCNLICDCRKIDMYPQQMTMQALDMEVSIVMEKNDQSQLKAPEMCH